MNQQFAGISDIYNTYRPSYPQEIIDGIADYSGFRNSTGILLDIGSGTGISTRLLRNAFDNKMTVIGIEPGNDMYQTAVDNSTGHGNLAYISANAENLPFQDSTINVIVTAQAIQWFKRDVFYGEVVRVLVNNGCFAVMQNNRDWAGNPFLDEYENIIEIYSPGYSRHYREIDIQSELNNIAALSSIVYKTAFWKRAVTKEQFIGMSFSSTKTQAAIKMHGKRFMTDKLIGLMEKYFPDKEIFEIGYITELYLARKI